MGMNSLRKHPVDQSLQTGSGLGNFVFVDDLFQIEVLTWFTKCGQIELSGGFGKFGPKL